MRVTWYTYPRGELRASEYHYHERGQWKSESYWGQSQEERDDKAVTYLSNRSSGGVQCVIRCRYDGLGFESNQCEEALLWERVEFLDDEIRRIAALQPKERPWPAIAR